MDLGVFVKRKATFWAWLLLPLLAMLVLYHALNVHCTLVEERLARRRMVLGLVPQIQGRLGVARDVVQGFAMQGKDRASMVGDAGTRTGEIARRNGVTINSLRVDEPDPLKQPNSKMISVELKGEGSLLSLLSFLNELHSPLHLSLVQSGTLQLSSGVGDVIYETELTVRCFQESSGGGPDV